MPRLYHTKSKTGCARCRSRRVKVRSSQLHARSRVTDTYSVMKLGRFVAAVNDTKSIVTMIVHPRQRQGHPQ
ncbi:hypothetical protein CEP54_005830 [Fusarium duplospermum]|uniref:Uncharacterized protein n=1 Tax=Fusarium duplospermum TaxID=1325734 RepID=A0A428QAB4_9HYPO|nr:hypothetical protein CEP54_005830 [Fusarium duplospermum]